MSNTSDKIDKNHRLPIRRGERIALSPNSRSPDGGDPTEIRSWLDEASKPWAIDLFAGAGGLSLGLLQGGFSVIAAAESDKVAMETHTANIPGLNWIGDLSEPSNFIRQLDDWDIGEVDLVAGGPPCQPFSNAGAAKIDHLVKSGNRPGHDGRSDLWQSFFEILDRLNPRAVLFENVPGFARANGGALLESLKDEIDRRGFTPHVNVLKAWQYGVPQHRHRLFVVGIKRGLDFSWPTPAKGFATVSDAINDLPAVPGGTRTEVQRYDGFPMSKLAKSMRRGLNGEERGLIRDHITRHVRPDDAVIYRLMKPGNTYLDVPEHLRRYRSDIFSDKYFRLSFENVSRTITAHIAKDGYWYIHPREDRTLSIREAARIQTFPDWFRFAGFPTNRYRQIGNAVPPMLATALAVRIREALKGEAKISTDDGRRP